MKILFIASAFAPYSFSESIVNCKLVLAFLAEGWRVDIISREYEGRAYSRQWEDEWKALRPLTHEIPLQRSGKILRFLDIVEQSFFFGFPVEGIRWARRAYEKALVLHREKKFDFVMSRSPSDIPHIVGEKFSRRTGTPWVANWNDPAQNIWPKPYIEKMNFGLKIIHSSYVGKMIRRASVSTFPSAELREHFANFLPTLNTMKSEIVPHIGFISIPFKKSSPSETFRICHSGNLSVERDPSSFFRAVARFIETKPEARIGIDLIGSSNEHVTALIRAYQLEQHVRYIGSYSFMKSLELMATYDLLLIIEADACPCIFLPSKLADYAQLAVPILAISPSGSCVSKIIERFGGGLAVDCNDEDKILIELEALYASWKNGNLGNEFDSESLYTYFSPRHIISIYQRLFASLRQVGQMGIKNGF